MVLIIFDALMLALVSALLGRSLYLYFACNFIELVPSAWLNASLFIMAIYSMSRAVELLRAKRRARLEQQHLEAEIERASSKWPEQ